MPYTSIKGVSTDSKFSHFAWATQSRKEGGLGPDLKLPLIADRSMNISRDYGVLLEDEGISLRGLFIIDPKGTLRWVTVFFGLALSKLFGFKGKLPSTTCQLVVQSKRPSDFSKLSSSLYVNILLVFHISYLTLCLGCARWSLPGKLDARLQNHQNRPHCQARVLRRYR